MTSNLSTDGVTRIGTYSLPDDTRIVATKYSAEAYKRHFLDRHTTSDHYHYFANYHNGHSLERRGTNLGRSRYSAELQNLSIDLDTEQQSRLVAYWDKENLSVNWESLDPEDPTRSIIDGTRFLRSTTRPTSDKTKTAHYVCGWYYAGMHAIHGIVIGRINFEDPSLPSTEENPVIDPLLRFNFDTVKIPTEDINIGHAACLYMANGAKMEEETESDPTDGDEVKVLSIRNNIDLGSGQQCGTASVRLMVDDEPISVPWTLAANVGFVLGAIHANNPWLLSSSRTPENMQRHDGSGLTVTGIEHAQARRSKGYELHTSKLWGESFIPIGAPSGETYGLTEAMNAVKDHTYDKTWRDSLSLMHDARNGLEEGEVIVESLEANVNGQWLGQRTRNQLSVGDSTKEVRRHLWFAQTLRNQVNILGHTYLMK